ncbi:MAG: endonuclease/exonuclease/phosphatase family protein [Pirellulales bacterium]
MAKARPKAKKRKTSRRFLPRIVSLVLTLTSTAGVGVGGWAYRDTPIVQSMVGKMPSWLTAVLPRTSDRSADTTGSLSPAGATAATPGQRLRNGVQQVARTGEQPPATSAETITIASFNIQVFGTSKFSKPEVMDVLVQVIRRFDLVAIQEIRCKLDSLLPDFVQRINADGSQYGFVIGQRLGRTVSKEQYAFIYNRRRIEVDPNSVLTMSDPNDELHREPLLAHFRVRGVERTRAFSFWLMNIHTDPDEAAEELDALANAFQSVQRDGWGEDDIILLGDLNADERHLGRLGQLPGIRYVVAGVPTNTRGTKTYDNIVFDQRATIEYSGQWGVMNLMREYQLSADRALKVSDHLPVWAVFSAYEGRPAAQLARQPGNPR